MENWAKNETDVALLKKTWSDDYDTLLKLGSDIYVYIFNHNPTCKRLFPWVIKYEDEAVNWKETQEFKDQALKFVSVIDTVFSAIVDKEESEQFLYEIGQRHNDFAKRGFQPSHWDAFLDAIQVALTNRMMLVQEITVDEKSRASELWRDVALHIIKSMKAISMD